MSHRDQPSEEPSPGESSRELIEVVSGLSPAAVAELYRMIAAQMPLRERVVARGLEFEMGVTSSFDRFRATTVETKEPETLDWLDAELGAGDVLYDIGANVGIYTLYAALRNPAAHVVAIEPAAPNVAALCFNVHANGLANVTVSSCGVGAAAGLETLHLSTLESGGSMHSTEIADVECFGESVVASHLIATLTIDEIAARLPPPTLMKIDIDGREGAALQGATSTLESKSLRSLLVELNWDARRGPAPIADQLAAYGFTLTRAGDELQRERRMWRNYIFDRRGERSRATRG